MKIFILTVSLMASMAINGMAQTETVSTKKEWTAQVGFTNSWLIDETVVSRYGTSDYYNDFSLGFNAKVSRVLADGFSLGMGYNAITFSEDSYTSAENISDLELSAFFLSLEFASDSKADVRGYGSIEFGVSDMEDIDYFDTPATGLYGLNIYESESNTYFSIGGGIKTKLNETMYLDVSYRYRHYGKFKRNATYWTAAIKDFDVATSGIDVSIGWYF